jgi:hypothetical protein
VEPSDRQSIACYIDMIKRTKSSVRALSTRRAIWIREAIQRNVRRSSLLILIEIKIVDVLPNVACSVEIYVVFGTGECNNYRVGSPNSAN